MDTPEKMILVGIGFLGAALLIAAGIVRRMFPNQERAKRMWMVVIPAAIVGLILLVTGSVTG